MVDRKPRAATILQDIQYDFRIFTISDFLAYVGQCKGRHIIAVPWRMPPTVFGAWMSDDEEPKEYIFYRDNVPAIHQIHIQLHELSHFLLGHPTLQINRKLIARVLGREASLPFADLVRLRSPLRSGIEMEAETLADLIQKRVIQNLRFAELTRASSAGTLAEVLKSMGGR